MTSAFEYTGRSCKLLAQNLTLFFLVIFVFLNLVDHYTSPISEGTCVSADTCRVARMAPSLHLRIRQARHAGTIIPNPYADEGEDGESIDETGGPITGNSEAELQNGNENTGEEKYSEVLNGNLDVNPPGQDTAVSTQSSGDNSSNVGPNFSEADGNLDEPVTQDAHIPPENTETENESENFGNLDLSSESDNEPPENSTGAQGILSENAIDSENEHDGTSTAQETLENALEILPENTGNSTDTTTDTADKTNGTLNIASWEKEGTSEGSETTEGSETNEYEDYEEEGEMPASPLDDPRPTYIPDPNDPSLEDIELELENVQNAMNETEGVEASEYSLPVMPMCAPHGRTMRLQNVLTMQCIGLNPLGKLVNYDCNQPQVLTFCVDPVTKGVKSTNGRCLGTRMDRDASKPAFLDLVPCAINARSIMAQGYWRFGVKNRLINSGNRLCLDVWHNRMNSPVCSWYCKPDNGYKPQNQMWGFV